MYCPKCDRDEIDPGFRRVGGPGSTKVIMIYLCNACGYETESESELFYYNLQRQEKEFIMQREDQERLGQNLVGVIQSVVRKELADREDEPTDKFETRAGRKWTDDEEEILVNEWRSFVYQCCAAHRRNPSGITARMRQLYKENRLCM